MGQEIVSKIRYLQIAPRKVRIVADLIRGMKVEEARYQLQFLTKRAARPILKLLNSAVANAKHNFNLEEEQLYISKILVDEGPTLKRWMPRARGMVSPINKRTSHITLILSELSVQTLKKSRLKKAKVDKIRPDGQEVKKEIQKIQPVQDLEEKEETILEKETLKPKKTKIVEIKKEKKPSALKGIKQKFFRRKSI